jgi:hypothetical protein
MVDFMEEETLAMVKDLIRQCGSLCRQRQMNNQEHLGDLGNVMEGT